MLRAILSGAVTTQFLKSIQIRHGAHERHLYPTKLDRFGLKFNEDPLGHCPFCSHHVCETLPHIWYEGPAWQHIRDQFPDSVSAIDTQWPNCFLFAGICPADPAVQQALDAISFSEDRLAIGLGVLIESPFVSNGYVVVWADGACTHQDDERIRRAGAGYFLFEDSSENGAFRVPGPIQTNNRGGLDAIVKAMDNLQHHGKLEFRTDSQTRPIFIMLLRSKGMPRRPMSLMVLLRK